jgi:hypothetical protein
MPWVTVVVSAPLFGPESSSLRVEALRSPDGVAVGAAMSSTTAV